MAVDKKINYAIQGGGPNYLGKQKMVRAPKKWKSSPTHPEAHLAYITDKEQDLLIKKNLYGSLKGKPNRGPSGIVSLQGDLGGYDASGGNQGNAGDNEAQNRRDQEASRTRAVLTGKIQKDPSTGNWEAGRNLGRRESLAGIGLGQNIGRSIRSDLGGRRSRMGGILGALGRGALSFFGGIPGKVLSGIMTAKNWAKNKGTGFMRGVGEFAEYDEEGNPMYPTLDRYLNRNTDKYLNKPYKGQGKSNYTFNDQDTAIDVPFDPNARISDTSFSNVTKAPLLNNQNYNTALGEGWATNYTGEDTDPNNNYTPFNTSLPMGSAEGGRIGYERGRVVNPGGYAGEKSEIIKWDPNLLDLNISGVKGSEIIDSWKRQIQKLRNELLQAEKPEFEGMWTDEGIAFNRSQLENLENKFKGGIFDKNPENAFPPEKGSKWSPLNWFAQGGRASYFDGGIARLL